MNFPPRADERDILELRRDRLMQVMLLDAISPELRRDLQLVIQDIDRRLSMLGHPAAAPLAQAA